MGVRPSHSSHLTVRTGTTGANGPLRAAITSLSIGHHCGRLAGRSRLAGALARRLSDGATRPSAEQLAESRHLRRAVRVGLILGMPSLIEASDVRSRHRPNGFRCDGPLQRCAERSSCHVRSEYGLCHCWPLSTVLVATCPRSTSIMPRLLSHGHTIKEGVAGKEVDIRKAEI